MTAVAYIDTLHSIRRVRPGLGGLPEDTRAVLLGGFRTAADGGGGNFLWIPNDTSADDGGTVIRPDSVDPTAPGRWKRLHSGSLNVKWFGARGDGSIDDAPAIQCTVDAAIGSDPLRPRGVFLPNGTYHLRSPLLIRAFGMEFAGEGLGSMLFPQTDEPALILDHPAGAAGGRCVLRNFTIDGAGQYAAKGAIVLRSAAVSSLRNLWVFRCKGDGILFDNSFLYPGVGSEVGNNDNVVVEACEIGANLGCGIRLAPGPDNNLIQFNWNQVQSNGKAGLEIRGAANTVRAGDWSGNWASSPLEPGIASIHSYGNSNVFLFPYTDSLDRTIKNEGSTGDIIHLYGGSAKEFVPGPGDSQTAGIVLPDWGENSTGLALLTGGSKASLRGLKIHSTAGEIQVDPAQAVTYPITQVYADGDQKMSLMLYSAGGGGIAFGYYGDPFQAQFSKVAVLERLVIPAGVSVPYEVRISNNTYSKAHVKPGDPAIASFRSMEGKPLPNGVFIHSVQVTGEFEVTVVLHNSNAMDVTLSGALRAQVTSY